MVDGTAVLGGVAVFITSSGFASGNQCFGWDGGFGGDRLGGGSHSRHDRSSHLSAQGIGSDRNRLCILGGSSRRNLNPLFAAYNLLTPER